MADIIWNVEELLEWDDLYGGDIVRIKPKYEDGWVTVIIVSAPGDMAVSLVDGKLYTRHTIDAIRDRVACANAEIEIRR